MPLITPCADCEHRTATATAEHVHRSTGGISSTRGIGAVHQGWPMKVLVVAAILDITTVEWGVQVALVELKTSSFLTA